MYASAGTEGSTSTGVLLVVADQDTAWVRSLRSVAGTTLLDPSSATDPSDEERASAEAALVDGALDTPLALGRRLRRTAPHLQLVFVSPPDGEERFRRAMLFAPGLGEPWVVTPEEATPELLERAADVGRRRREHARRSPQIAEKVDRLLPETEGPARLSDRYLATLLELLPEPVLALDDDDRVLFANPVAASLFRLRTGASPRRRHVRTLLDPADPAVLDDLLQQGREGVARARVTLRTTHGERSVHQAALAPVGGDPPIRALVLHDVTEQVEAREKLERQAARLEEEARRRQRLLDERDRALGDLRELMRRRSRFYANISHELRTPLNAIVGYNDLLLGDVFGGVSDDQREALDRIRQASQHLTDLIEDLLDLSKIETERLSLEPEEVDPSELLADVGEALEPLARAQDVDLRIRVGPRGGEPFGTDPQRLRQIVTNLLSNAVRFGAGRPVDVRCRRRGRTLVIEVEDRGPGIPPERREEIFEEFVQLDRPAEGAGVGLGLSITRSLARSFGGDVEVESEPGRGSVFTVTIPEMEAP